MQHNQNVSDTLLLTYFTPDELGKLSVPQLRLLEALRYEPMPEELVHLDENFRARCSENDATTQDEATSNSQSKAGSKRSTPKSTEQRRYRKQEHQPNSEESDKSHTGETSTLEQLPLLKR
jgi:hypothetical protein